MDPSRILTAGRSRPVDRIEWRTAGDITSPLITRWNEIVDRCPEFRSPFLQFEYARQVELACPGVRIAVLEVDDVPVGFWPVQERERSRVATPAGGTLSGLQAMPLEAPYEADPCQLLHEAGLTGYQFYHQLTTQRQFAPYTFETSQSPFIDVGRGFDHYLEDRLSRGHTNRNILNAARKKRRLVEEVGTASLESRCRSLEVLDLLISWKRVQLRQTARRDPFHRFPWIHDFLRRCLELEEPRFRGEMHVLRAGEIPVAVLYGLRSFESLHGIILGFDRRFAACSPGIVLLVELARAAPSLGLELIHLGKGNEFYKKTLESRSLLLSTGLVTASRFSKLAGLGRHLVKSRLSRSVLGEHVRRITGRLQRSTDALRR